MRTIAGTAAAALFIGALAGSLLVLDPAAFVGHMAVHMGIVVVVAPLAALAIAGSPFDPSRRWHPGAAVAFSLLELVVVWAWHVPVLRAVAEGSEAIRLVELATFLIAGALLWVACLGGNGTTAAKLSGAGALLLTTMHMTLLGVLLTLAPRPLYSAQSISCLGFVLSPEQDQQLGGVVMLLLGASAYLAGGLYLMSAVLRERSASQRVRL